jgi:hypothetical protein
MWTIWIESKFSRHYTSFSSKPRVARPAAKAFSIFPFWLLLVLILFFDTLLFMSYLFHQTALAFKPSNGYSSLPQPMSGASSSNGSGGGPITRNSSNLSIHKSGYSLYVNSFYKIKMLYPSSWLVNEEDITPHNEIIKIVSFTKDPNSFSGDFVLGELSLNSNITKRLSIYSLLTDNIKAYSQYYYTDFHILKSTLHASIFDNPAYELLFTDKLGTRIMKTIQMGTIIGGKVYITQYYADKEKYPVNLSKLQIMIKSLQIAG